MTVAGLVLAAGAGTRLGRPKALVRMGGELLVERAVRLLGDGGCDRVVVVLGAAADEVRAVAQLPRVVVNPDWPMGLSSSLSGGLAALRSYDPDGEVEAAVVALVDQPRIGPEAVRRLIAAWRAGAEVAVASYRGRPLNPVLFSRDVWSDVAQNVAGDTGARDWLGAHPAQVTLVPCDDTGRPDDIDTPADLLGLTEED